MGEGRKVETVDGIINEMQDQSGFDARDYVENIKNLGPVIAVSDLHLYAARIKEAHDREPELCGDVAQRALEYIKELEESNRKLMKETSGLLKSLNVAVGKNNALHTEIGKLRKAMDPIMRCREVSSLNGVTGDVRWIGDPMDAVIKAQSIMSE